ncbi:MAG: hypothetical protein GY898_00210 [Proteobacteria bacterium]|nr:hypothetical protein [Pseudomonadota bacterium]
MTELEAQADAPVEAEQTEELHLRRVGRAHALIVAVASVTFILAEVPLLLVEDADWAVRLARGGLLAGLVLVAGLGFIVAGRSIDGLRRTLGSLRVTEALLRDSEEAKAVLLDAIPDQMLKIVRGGRSLQIHSSGPAPPGHSLSPRQWPRLAQMALPFVDKALADGKAQEFGFQVEGLHGAPPVHFQIRIVVAGDDELFAMVSDVTERRFLEGRLLDAGAQERDRVGRELHDGICQHLAGTTLIAKTLLGKLEREQGVTEDELRRLTILIEDATGEARAIARGMIPVTVERLGLAAALEQVADDLERMHDVEIVSNVDVGRYPPDDPHIALQLFRIAQEAMTNAIKHAEPDQITLTVRSAEGGDVLVMEVEDDGVGIDVEKLRSDSMGLRIMDYRARLIGAFLEIEQRAEGGTRVRCRVATVPEPTHTDEPRPVVNLA